MRTINSFAKARKYHLWLLALTITGVVLEVFVSANREGTAFDNSFVRALNLFVYFTIFSNILVGVTSYSIYKNNKEKLSTRLHTAYVAAIICITTTLIIHRLFLAGPLSGSPLVSDIIIHVLVPIFALIGWLFFSSQQKVTLQVGLLAIGYPTGWLIATFARGAITNWYPYTFLDPQQHSLLKILLTVGQIYLLFFAILASLMFVSKYKQNNRS